MYVTEEVASAAGCLWLLARREEHRQKIAKHLLALKTLLECGNHDAKTWCACPALLHLTIHGDTGGRLIGRQAVSSESLHPVCRAAGICWMLALHKGNRAAMKSAGLVALPKKGKKGKKKSKKGEAAVKTVTDEATTRFYAIGALRNLTLEDPLLKVAAACTAPCR